AELGRAAFQRLVLPGLDVDLLAHHLAHRAPPYIASVHRHAPTHPPLSSRGRPGREPPMSPQPPDGAPDWAAVRDRFPVTRNVAYMNCGWQGPMSRETAE